MLVNELENYNTSISITAGLMIILTSAYAFYKDIEANRPPQTMSVVRMNV